MKLQLLSVAIVLVRAWTRVYTWRLPQPLRESRRAEIESDLWESRHDAGRRQSPAVQVIVRLLLGIPDDLQWRMAHASIVNNFVMIGVALTTAVFLLAALWLVDLARARKLPVPPPPRLSSASLVAPRPAVHDKTPPVRSVI